MKPVRKAGIITSKILISVLLTVGLVEIGLRLVPGVIPLDLLVLFSDKPRAQIARSRGLPTKKWDTVKVDRDDGGPELRIFRPDTQVSWPIEEQGIVSLVQMDEIGFCNPTANSYQLPTIDLITLGDSFTACHAVDPPQTWTSQLSSMTGLSAYNLGKGGTGIHEHIQILKQFGLKKSPKIVIINVYEGNDFRDAANYYYYLLGQSEAQAASGQLTDSPAASASFLAPMSELIGDKILKNNSYAFNLTLASIEFWQATEPGSSSTAGVDDPSDPAEESPEENDRSDQDQLNFRYQLVFPRQDVITFNLDNTDTDEVEYAVRLLNEEIDPGIFWSVRESLRAFVELSQEHGFVPVVTYTPSAHTAYAEHVEFEDPALKELMPWFSREQRKFLTVKSEELGFIFVDLTPPVRAAARAGGSGNLLYYRYDLHLTLAGHTAVATAINQALQDQAIIP